MTLRLTVEEAAALRETARREGRSMQDVARTAIVQYAAQRSRRRDDHLASIVAQDAVLLKRLGSE
jgi:Ribbon-helix-helix protein, copG family.